jgi:hypothetical protein
MPAAYPYTTIQRFDMVIFYGQTNSTAQTQESFRERYPESPVPTHNLIRRTIQNLRDFGQFSVPAHAQALGRPFVHPASLYRRIRNFFIRNPQASTRQAARRFRVSQIYVWRLLNASGMHPYRFQKVQDLMLADYAKRVQLCQWLLQNQDTNILWTDEATFTRIGLFNQHNEHWWGEQNPHVVRKHAFQTRFSANVWAGIVNNTIIGPYFIEGGQNGRNYLEFLRHVLPGMLAEVAEENLVDLHYQQDGAPAHFQRDVRNYLDNEYPGRWIGRSGPIQWPPRSPDLTPLDFYLWGEVKRRVYEQVSDTIAELRLKIISAFDEVKADEFVLRRVKRNHIRRAQLCLELGGEHFEHLLKYV